LAWLTKKHSSTDCRIREVWNDKEKGFVLGRGFDVVFLFANEKHDEDMRGFWDGIFRQIILRNILGLSPKLQTGLEYTARYPHGKRWVGRGWDGV